MKKFILTLSIFSCLINKAQILNPSFENVTANKPNNWNTSLYGYNTYQIRDTAVPHTGTRAAYIRGLSSQSYSIQGAVLGVFSATGTPAALQGWYKCNIMPGDSLVFNPYVYQGTTLGPFAAAYSFTTGSTSIYKQFTAAFNYTLNSVTSIDTVYTGIYLSGINVDGQGVAIPQTGTWAIIDDIAFSTSTVTGLQQTGLVNVIETVYPQPATTTAFLVYNLTEAATCSLKLLDVTGKELKIIFENDKQTSGKYKAELPVYDLVAGIYFAELKINGEVRVAKIIKE
jgi:hypothetical protein